jgi:hypothetical protein
MLAAPLIVLVIAMPASIAGVEALSRGARGVI